MRANNVVTEFDVIVLGLGPGGEEVAERLAEAGWQVLGIEASLVGGECPYFGCIPSKMLLRAAETIAEAGRVDALAGTARVTPDFTKVAKRISAEATDGWDDTVAAARFTGLGGQLVRGHGKFAGRDAHSRVLIEVAGQQYAARRAVVVATGTAPAIPSIAGLHELAATELSPDGLVWTNREVFRITEAPTSLLVIGGGAIGTELCQGFARFGTDVTQLEAADRLLSVEEPEASATVAAVLRAEGVDVRTGVSITTIRAGGSGVVATLADGTELTAAKVLVAAGRSSQLPELALETVGLDPEARTLTVDDHMQVSESIYAVGDVTGRGAFTHVAVWQARVLVGHLLGVEQPFGGYHGLAWVTFTDPEVGRVGMTEQQARDAGLDVAIGCADVAASARGWIHGAGNEGFVKLVADRTLGHLVGATVTGPSGGEILGMLTLAVHARVPVSTLASMHYAYPTLHRAIDDAVRAIA